MRTIFFLIVIVVYSTSQILAQLPDEALKRMVVEHDIKSLTQFNHKYSDGKPKEDGYKNFYKEFDKHGNLIKEIHYRDGEISQKMTYKFNEDQKKTEYENYDAKEDEVSYRQNIEYNRKGKKITEKRYNGSEYFKLNYEYNENGDLHRILKKKKTGEDQYELQEKRIFEHNGNTKKISVLDQQDNLVKKIVNEYDDEGHLIKESEYSPEEERIKKFLTEYNQNGQKVLEEKYQKDNFIYKKQYEYDRNGNLVEVQKEQPEEEFVISKVYEYSQENISKEMWLEDMDDKYSHKKFIFDDEGILDKVEVYYAIYQYHILYTFDYEFF
ncbi:MAG: hypothetical protein ACQESJ_06140 [Bacteroidota bacterium]